MYYSLYFVYKKRLVNLRNLCVTKDNDQILIIIEEVADFGGDHSHLK